MLLTALLVLAASLVAGCGRGDDDSSSQDPGVTKDSIKIGGIYPFSGPASAYGDIAEGAKAYFDMVNDKGGVDGRKIEFVTVDDSYEPPKAVQASRKLVEQDKVFALFNTLGTPSNLAIWDYTNQEKVPQVYVATGASEFGADVKKHPFTTGWQPNYVTEARIYADYLKKEKPNAKVGILYQNDGFGKDLTGGFEEALKGSDVKVVAKESYEVTDPSVASQVKKLSSSGADTFLNVTTPKFSAQAIAAVAKSGWKPLHILNNVGASKTNVLAPVGLENAKDIVSTAYFKDPEDPEFADDPAMKEFKAQLKKSSPKANPNEPFHVFGWAAAATMTEALKGMKEPTRDALMKSVRNMDTEIPILLPGVKVKTSGESDGYPIEAMQIIQFDGENWQRQGKVLERSAEK